MRRHSPTGLEFGYGGSGPAQLALAILLDFTGDRVRAERSYQAFKRAFIARGRGDAMVIHGDEIQNWLDEQEAPAIAAWSRSIATR